MNRTTLGLGLYLLFCSAGAARLSGGTKCVQEATAVKLPPVDSWRVALGCAEPERQTVPEGTASRAGVERAWRSYLDNDALASRVELGNWLPDLLDHGETAEIALALSVAKLDAATGSPSSLADDLTQARPKWREIRDLSSWVDLFDGAAAERQKATEAAERNWTTAANAEDAPLRVRGLAHLGLAQLAVNRNSAREAMANLQAAEREFRSGGDVRGVAEVLILRIRAFSASHETADADSAAAAAESYCRERGLADGVVESLLAVSDGARASGDEDKAAATWARAEDEALLSGRMPIRVLNLGELVQLKQYARVNLDLSKSREYFRWAAGTGNLVLIERSSRAMAAALKQSGQIGASGWYGLMAEDAAASLARLPASTRLLHAALIDYGLLEAGVDPGSRSELFVGTAWAAFCRELVAGIGRIEKLSPDNDLEDLNGITAELERLGKQADLHRESALGALRRKDGKRATKEFAEFFQILTPLRKKLGELSAQENADQEQAPDDNADPKLTYAAGLLDAWSMRDPKRLRNVIAALRDGGMPVEVPVLLPTANSAKGSAGSAVNVSSRESDSEALAVAVARGRAAKGRSWPRLVTRYAAAGGGSAVTAVAFGVEPEKLNEQEAAQLQIAYAGQFALAANGEVPHVQLGGDQNFEWFFRKLRTDYSLSHDIEGASRFGLMVQLAQMAYLSTERGAERLANTKYFRAILEQEPDMPDFDSLEDDQESVAEDAKGDTTAAGGEATAVEGDAPPRGFLRGFEFTVWSVQYPVLLNAIVRPESPFLEKMMSDALADMEMKPARQKEPLPYEIAKSLGPIESTRRSVVLDLALSALAGKRYGEAIRWLSRFEAMMPSGATLEQVQVKYVKAMCYRGWGDAGQEEAQLRSAGEELESLRRSLATRNASLRLRDLRQLIQEEYLSALYRRGDWTGMARAIAAYRVASVLPAAVLAVGARRHLAQELETLKDTYNALAAGAKSSPVTRQDYRELFKLFKEPERLPSGDPTLNAIEQATYLVTNELYAETSSGPRGAAVIRRADRGELLILQSVGHAGVHTVTIDERGRTAGYYRYMPIASLEALCQDFETSLQAGGNSGKAGAQLYDKLLAYIPEMKGKRRLSILADGPLQNLAWEALPESNGRYLIEKFEIGISSGTKPASGGGSPPAHGLILAITNPDADAEADGQLATIGADRSHIILLEGTRANLPNIQRALPRAEAVYISTHGESDYLRPDYSFLELAGGTRLYSLDLGNLDFSGRRLLLSACETRTGKTYGGEDVYGLADAFLARNASTVVATRWRVEAPAAAAFSAAFYESLREGADYTAAAAQAARSLLKGQQSEWRGPRHWAAYEPVTRFFDAGGKSTTRLIDAGGSQDSAETARIAEVLQDDRRRAETERHELTEKETALNAELIEFANAVTLEENTNSILWAQVPTGRRTEKWIAATLKTARTALETNPQWKPAERLQLTVRVKDESGASVPGAMVSADDVSRRARTSQSTDAGGRAVFLDMRAANGYLIAVSANGFLRALSYSEDEGDIDAWFGDAEKVIIMRPVKDTDEPEESPVPQPKPATDSPVRKPVAPRAAGRLQALLDEINGAEAANEILPARIAELQAERTAAQEALALETQNHQSSIKKIDEHRRIIDEELRELNAILRQTHLTELQMGRFEISGTVKDKNVRKIQAKVTLQTVGADAVETATSDGSGHFVFADATPGAEYAVTAEAEGNATWRSLPITFYFPCSLSIYLRAPEDSAHRRRFRR